MKATARASIDVGERKLRYAEVEQYNGRYRLLRLGSCEFEFDVVDELSRPEPSDRLDTVAEALEDVFAGASPDELYVVLHPPRCRTFFSPVPSGATKKARREQLGREAALLAGEGGSGALHLSTDTVYAEEYAEDTSETDRVEWTHVLALPERSATHFERVLQPILPSTYRWAVSMQGAAQAVERAERISAEEPVPYALALGWYPTHVEYVLCQEGQWRYSHYTTASSPADGAYFALALLRRLDVPVDSVGRVLMYGTGSTSEELAPFQRLLGHRPEWLNPLELIDFEPDNLASNFDAGPYLPCIGITL